MKMKAVLLAGLMLLAVSARADLKVALITGGHGFDEKTFFEMFHAMPGMAVTHIDLKDDSPVFDDISAWPYDVIALYNMTQKISEKQQANFVALLNKGVGLVVLHHAIASYNEWPEYWKIIGCRYFLKDVEENGVKYPRCTWAEGVEVPVRVADPKSPVMAGVKDFTVEDEVYKGYKLEPDNHYILNQDNPTGQKEIGWTRAYGKSKVCFLQPGHGPGIFADPNYRRMVLQAIQWSASK